MNSLSVASRAVVRAHSDVQGVQMVISGVKHPCSCYYLTLLYHTCPLHGRPVRCVEHVEFDSKPVPKNEANLGPLPAAGQTKSPRRSGTKVAQGRPRWCLVAFFACASPLHDVNWSVLFIMVLVATLKQMHLDVSNCLLCCVGSCWCRKSYKCYKVEATDL
jgi:hypothetical protein